MRTLEGQIGQLSNHQHTIVWDVARHGIVSFKSDYAFTLVTDEFMKKTRKVMVNAELT